jgi:hypothetical protein
MFHQNRVLVTLLHSLMNNSCGSCETHLSVFSLHVVKSNSEICKKWYANLDDLGKKNKLDRQQNMKTSDGWKQKKAKHMRERREALRLDSHEFPPLPPSEILQETIARGWSEDTSPDVFMEGGCAVCGQLAPVNQLSRLSESGCDLNILVQEGIGLTRLERFSVGDPIQEVKGPILESMDLSYGLGIFGRCINKELIQGHLSIHMVTEIFV